MGFILWNPKHSRGPVDANSVVIAHADADVGESVALLLRLRGLVAIYAPGLETLELMIEHWKPRALLIDMRLCRSDDFRFVRNARDDPAYSGVLIVALTGAWPDATPTEARSLGFDGLCHRRCPVWRLANVLTNRDAVQGDSPRG
jgi:CheY-like chemotaxis protein